MVGPQAFVGAVTTSQVWVECYGGGLSEIDIEIEITLMGVRVILLCRTELVLRYVELEEGKEELQL